MKSAAFALGLLAIGVAGPAFAFPSLARNGSFEEPRLQTCCKRELKKGELSARTVTSGKVVLTGSALEQGGFAFKARRGSSGCIWPAAANRAASSRR